MSVDGPDVAGKLPVEKIGVEWMNDIRLEPMEINETIIHDHLAGERPQCIMEPNRIGRIQNGGCNHGVGGGAPPLEYGTQRFEMKAKRAPMREGDGGASPMTIRTQGLT